MARNISVLIKNINFDLRLAECVVCFFGMIVVILTNHAYNGYYYWSVHGWFLDSLALLIAYIFDKPNVWLEVILIILHLFPVFLELFYFSKYSLFPVINGTLMFIDLVFLIIKRNK